MQAFQQLIDFAKQKQSTISHTSTDRASSVD